MIIQAYEYKGIQLQSALKVTSFNFKNRSDLTFDVDVVINRYTDSTCQYDIEQFTKTFTNITSDDIGSEILDLAGDLEELLLTLPEFQGATQV